MSLFRAYPDMEGVTFDDGSQGQNSQCEDMEISVPKNDSRFKPVTALRITLSSEQDSSAKASAQQ